MDLPTMTPARKWLLAGLAALVVLAGVVVLVARPRTMGQKVLDVVEVERSVAVAGLALENIEPNRGTVKIRLTLHSGGQPLPPSGATLITNIAGLGPLRLPTADLISEASAETILDAGDLGDYPFDEYGVTVSMALVEGTEITEQTDPTTVRYLPFSVLATSMLNGFEAQADAHPSPETHDVTDLRFTMSRPVPTILWALAMMAIFWLLAIGAAGVAMAILLGLRPFETRHLAWLTAMLFAFAAFRGTAPGSPPIGVFLDYGGFFWAVAIVVAAELVLLVAYLSGSKRGTPA